MINGKPSVEFDLKLPDLECAFYHAHSKLKMVQNAWPYFFYRNERAENIKSKVKLWKWSALGEGDYQKNAFEFNRAYLSKNLVKCSIACFGLQNARSDVVYDVGGGAGIFGAMWKSRHGDSSIIIVDRSNQQLDLSSMIYNIIGFQADRILSDAELYFSETRADGIRLFSYFLCEQMSRFSEMNWNNIIGNCGVFVDYWEVLGALNSLPKNYSVSYSRVEAPLPRWLSTIIGENKIYVNVAIAENIGHSQSIF